MAVNIMLDLETFGTGNDAAIISIGAVKFTQTQILDRFHVGVDPASSESAGLKINASTVMWWLDPERAAAWAAWAALEKVDLPLALTGFGMWYTELPTDSVGGLIYPDSQAHTHGEKLPIWGNGATFDNVILRSAYEVCGLKYPAPFYLDKCYRTIKELAPEVKLERIGAHPSAVDDAESQAVHLQKICAQLGVEL